MADFVGAVDQGTTSTRFMIFDHAGNEVGRHQLEHEQILPRAGWVEHNPVEIWERTDAVIADRAAHAPACSAGDLAALGITNQRETTVVWNRATGRPYYNAIVWQDTRTDRIATRAGPRRPRRRHPAQGRAAAGDLLLRRQDPVDPGERRRRPRGGRARATRSSAPPTPGCSGTSPAASTAACTSPTSTNASRTMLMDLETLDWDDELLAFFGIPRAMLPEIRPVVRPGGVRRDPRLTARSAARSRSPATSATSRRPPSARSASRPARPRTPTAPATSCCSTPATELVRVQARAAHHGLLPVRRRASRSTRSRARSRSPARPCSGCATSSASSPARPRVEALARAGRRQRRRLLRARRSPACSRRTGAPTPAARSSGCPASTPTPTWPGPRWRRSATRAATSPRRWSRTPASHLEVLKVDGGVTANDLCMQMQADILGVPVSRPVVAETTALGAAYAAGLATGFWSDHRRAARELERVQALGADVDRRAARRRATPGWKKAVERTLDWVDVD